MLDDNLLGFKINHFSRSTQLGICISGTFVFFCSYAYIQESLFRIDGFHFGWYLTFIQFFVYAFISSVELYFHGEMERRSPLSEYFLIAFFMVVTMGMSNTACTYLPYATQVLFKSSKLIPVMIGGKLLLNKQYSLFDYISAAFIVVGLITMTLGDVNVVYGWNITGIFLLCGALTGDAFTSNLQERVMKKYRVTQREMVSYSHSIGCCYLLVILVCSELSDAFWFCFQHPQTYAIMILFALFGYLGIQCILAMIRTFDSLIAMIVTSCRKVVTILLSFILFPKPFSYNYIFAVLFVFSGISCQIYTKNTKQILLFLKQLKVSKKIELQSIKVVE